MAQTLERLYRDSPLSLAIACRQKRRAEENISAPEEGPRSVSLSLAQLFRNAHQIPRQLLKDMMHYRREKKRRPEKIFE